MPIRTVIVDDELLARSRVKRVLADEPDIEIIGEFGDGRSALAAIRELKPDLAILDIQMPEMNGFDVVRSLESDAMPAVIFVTAYDQYALQAFDLYALDYLLKPFDRKRAKRAVERAREHIRNRERGDLDERLLSLVSGLKKPDRKYLERLVIRSTGRIFFLKTEEVDWIEASGNYLRIHVGRDAHMIRETMNSIEAKLDPEKFIRIHRSTIVNIDSIRELHPMFSGDYSVLLKDGTELALSRNYRERLIELVGPERES
jgi:two-component system LytT family response regulator